MKKKYAVLLALVAFALGLLVACVNGRPGATIFHRGPQVAVLYRDTSFLNEEQQAVYERACELYHATVYSTEGWTFARGEDGYISRVADGLEYHRIEGEYSRWADFKALWDETFTEGWFEEHNTYYREFEGDTWVVVGARTVQWTPDATYYEVGFARDDMLVFYANPQYEDTFAGMEDTTRWQEYNMVQLVQTEDGWRCRRIEG